jgi:hypothetical protein
VGEGVGVLRKIHDAGEDETPARVGLLGWEVVIAIVVIMGGVGGGVRHVDLFNIQMRSCKYR